MNALERLKFDVEEACNSGDGLLRLVQSLLEFEKIPDGQRAYVAQLVWYVLFKRRKEIYHRSGRLVSIPRMPSGCGVDLDYEVARDCARDMEAALAACVGEEYMRDLKRRIGRRLSLNSCRWRIQEGNFDV